MEMIKVANGSPLLNLETAEKIVSFERAIKSLKEQEDSLKAVLMAEMMEKNIYKLETADLAITYIAPTTRETFDSKALRKANPDLYDEFVKITPVSGSVRMKLK